MNTIVYLLIISIFITDFVFKQLGGAFRVLSWIPELLSVATMLSVIFLIVTKKVLLLNYKYLMLITFFAVLICIGVFLNQVQPGAIFAGLRAYCKYLPFFLLPAVYQFSDKQIKGQLKLILCLLLGQLPIVVYQRFVKFKGLDTGDYVVGTLNISSILSITLICAIAVTFAFYLRKQLSLSKMLAILFVLFIPLTLNETKSSLVLLPFALAVPALLWAYQQRKISAIVPMFVFGFVLIGAFVLLYNQSLGQTRDRSITEFVSSGDYKSYLYKGSQGREVSSGEEPVGKIDSYILAFKYLAKDIATLSFGIGIGNVSPGFSETLKGDYERYAHFAPKTTAVSFLMWETGLVGLFLVFVGCFIVFGDALHLIKQGGIPGVLALGWAAVVIIYTISLGYKNIVTHNVIGYLFWFYSGYLAACCLRVRRAI